MDEKEKYTEEYKLEAPELLTGIRQLYSKKTIIYQTN
jgi:hypothetical protein